MSLRPTSPPVLPINLTCKQIKIKETPNRPGVTQRVPGNLGSQIPWHSLRKLGEVVSLTHRAAFIPKNVPGTHFSTDWVDPRAMVRSEGDMSLKNPVTPLAIDLRTVRLVPQLLNHYATPGPKTNLYLTNYLVTLLIAFSDHILHSHLTMQVRNLMSIALRYTASCLRIPER